MSENLRAQAFKARVSHSPSPTGASPFRLCVTLSDALTEVSRLEQENADALALLAPNDPSETLAGAIRNLQQAYMAERDNVNELEQALREQGEARAVLADGLQAAVTRLSIEARHELFETTSVHPWPAWARSTGNEADIAAIRKALAILTPTPNASQEPAQREGGALEQPVETEP